MHSHTLRAIFRRALVLAGVSACSPYGMSGNMLNVVQAPLADANVAADATGYLPLDVCNRACLTGGDRLTVRSCHRATLVQPPQPDEPRIVCDMFYAQQGSSSFIGPMPSGRAPSGMQARAHAERDAVTEYFAEVAYLEAASVIAFRRLERDLAEHGAPMSLRRRARRAAADEARHARAARTLARARGARVERVTIAPMVSRSLEEVARENAVEGCVRETYAALVARHQAAHAEDPMLRRAMKRIAPDEERHAALAWSVHDFAMGRLTAAARRRVALAAAAARRALAVEVSRTRADVARELGVPHGAHARALATSLARLLDVPPTSLS